MRFFGTDGVRGIFNMDLTPSLVFRIARAICFHYSSGKFALGRDGRTSSALFSHIVESVMLASGKEIEALGLAPTPAVQFTTIAKRCISGISVTASHNTPEYNGIKIFGDNGIEIAPEVEVELENLVTKGNCDSTVEPQNFRTYSNFTEWRRDYVSSILANVSKDAIKNAKLKVVVDCANGVGGLVTPGLLRDLACKVTTINSNIDGSFPGRAPEPTSENLVALREAVLALNADLGIAHDGDADRAVCVDSKGNVAAGDSVLALLARHCFEKSKTKTNTFVTPINTSRVVDFVIDRIGGRVVRTKVGSAHVSQAMIKEGAEIGGEDNGGFIYRPHIPVRDGAMTSALLLELLAETGLSLHDHLSQLPRFNVIRSKIACPNSLKEAIVQKVALQLKTERLETLDGVKASFDDGSSVLVRASGTEPAIRVSAEAISADRAKQLADEAEAKVREAIKLIS